MNGKHNIATFFLAAFFVLGLNLPSVSAAIKDTDADGISDTAEVGIYHTDPLVFDTDGDGRGDGDEILDKTDPLDAQSSILVALMGLDSEAAGSPEELAWYLSQMSDIVAFLLLSGVVIFWLLAGSTRFSHLTSSATAYEKHHSVLWLALGMTLLYLASLFFNGFMEMKGLEEIETPFRIAQNVQPGVGFNVSTAEALAAIIFYLVLISVFTTEFRSKMSPRVWRRAYYLSAMAYIIFVAYAFFGTGVNLTEWWMRAMYSLSVSVVSLLILERIFSRILAGRGEEAKEIDQFPEN